MRRNWLKPALVPMGQADRRASVAGPSLEILTTHRPRAAFSQLLAALIEARLDHGKCRWHASIPRIRASALLAKAQQVRTARAGPTRCLEVGTGCYCGPSIRTRIKPSLPPYLSQRRAKHSLSLVRAKELLDAAGIGMLRPRRDGRFTVTAYPRRPTALTLPLLRRMRCSSVADAGRHKPFHERTEAPVGTWPGFESVKGGGRKAKRPCDRTRQTLPAPSSCGARRLHVGCTSAARRLHVG
jgi:hypothetical protein